jgi:uncharacterized protein YndB with AHSA1/START domain
METTEVPMNNVLVCFEYDHPAARLWQIIGDPAGLASWHPALARSPQEGNVRTCVLNDGAVIRERIEDQSQAERMYRYTMVESPLPVRNYQSTLRVREVGAARCRVEWSSTFEAPAEATAQMIEMVRGIYDAGLTAVRDRLHPA